MNPLYPHISPLTAHQIDVGDGHLVHVEECGNPNGRVVLFLHGGPGSGCNAGHRRYFDPRHYRIVLVDQRGSGCSTPFGGALANTTDLLVRDLETVRQRLGIDRWLLFGGSWGAPLALAYAQRHAVAVTGLILRGAFLGRREDLAWFFGPNGVARVFPDAYAELLRIVPLVERRDLIGAYHRCVHGDDAAAAFEWARAWTRWADRIATWTLPAFDEQGEPDQLGLLAKVRIETHYAVNRYFLADRPLLGEVPRLPDVPITIVHGRRDLVCPVESSWTLHHPKPPYIERMVYPARSRFSTNHALVALQDVFFSRILASLRDLVRSDFLSFPYPF